MSLIGWIFVGLVAGWLARRLVSDERSGCIYTIVIGIIGALVGGALFSLVTDRDAAVDGFNLASIGVAFIGSCIFLLVLKAIAGSRGRVS
ncbi:MAG: GlsB/YeaQ/YmgE family stress response membrane protein [Ilumatobacteraceae bacterium]